MRAVAVVFVILLAYQPCSSRPSEEESVVSVYTSQDVTSSGTHPPHNVYHQIASNIAERIASPIYRFLGIGKNKTDLSTTTKRPWEKIEILDDGPEEATKASYPPVDNDISKDRDVEELSAEAQKKDSRKPEKITLYSSYLPVKGNIETLDVNNTINEVNSKHDDDEDDDDSFSLDDVAVDGEEGKAGDSTFFYVLEILGSIAQLVWGGITAWFQSSSSTDNPS